MGGGMPDKQAVVDLAFIHPVKAKHPARAQGTMRTGDTGFEPVDAGTVVDGVQKAGNQIKGLVKAKLAHIPLGESSLWAALLCFVQHGLIQVEPLAGVAKVDKGADMGAGAAGQVQMLKPLIAKQLMQPAHRGALGLVVDIEIGRASCRETVEPAGA